MSTSFIDLPEDLQPVAFFQSQDVEDRLTDRSRTMIDLCKEVWQRGKWGEVPQRDIEQLIREVKGLWAKHGEQVGPAVAFLWLADWYWRNGMLESVCQCCEKAIEHLPDGPLPAYTLPKAVARYMLGLSHQMSDNMSQALYSYQEALELFKATLGYWQRVGDKQAEICIEVVGCVEGLIKYVGNRWLNPPAGNQVMLVCPWRSSALEKGKYVLGEIPLAQPVTARDMGPARSKLLSLRGRAWRWIGDDQQIGYQIGRPLRVLGINDTPQSFNLRTLNRSMKAGANWVLPSGATYYALAVGDQLALPNEIDTGDYILTWSTKSPDPDLLATLRHTGDGAIAMGVFERDSAGTVNLREVVKPERVIGEPEANFTPLGSVDFILRPA